MKTKLLKPENERNNFWIAYCEDDDMLVEVRSIRDEDKEKFDGLLETEDFFFYGSDDFTNEQWEELGNGYYVEINYSMLLTNIDDNQYIEKVSFKHDTELATYYKIVGNDVPVFGEEAVIGYSITGTELTVYVSEIYDKIIITRRGLKYRYSNHMKRIKEIDLDNIYMLSNNYGYFFMGYSSLKKIDLKHLIYQSVGQYGILSLNGMFKGCSRLEEVNFPSSLGYYDMDYLETHGMFSGCEMLSRLRMPFLDYNRFSDQLTRRKLGIGNKRCYFLHKGGAVIWN